jgi:RNase adaptor protein for sRNA GlmZ degradation
MPQPPADARKGHTGLHSAFREEVFRHPGAEAFYQSVRAEVLQFLAEHKPGSGAPVDLSDVSEDDVDETLESDELRTGATLCLGFGCHAGLHRSVALVERLSHELRGPPFVFEARHRDVRKRGGRGGTDPRRDRGQRRAAHEHDMDAQ